MVVNRLLLLLLALSQAVKIFGFPGLAVDANLCCRLCCYVLECGGISMDKTSFLPGETSEDSGPLLSSRGGRTRVAVSLAVTLQLLHYCWLVCPFVSQWQILTCSSDAFEQYVTHGARRVKGRGLSVSYA